MDRHSRIRRAAYLVGSALAFARARRPRTRQYAPEGEMMKRNWWPSIFFAVVGLTLVLR